MNKKILAAFFVLLCTNNLLIAGLLERFKHRSLKEKINDLIKNLAHCHNPESEECLKLHSDIQEYENNLENHTIDSYFENNEHVQTFKSRLPLTVSDQEADAYLAELKQNIQQKVFKKTSILEALRYMRFRPEWHLKKYIDLRIDHLVDIRLDKIQAEYRNFNNQKTIKEYQLAKEKKLAELQHLEHEELLKLNNSIQTYENEIISLYTTSWWGSNKNKFINNPYFNNLINKNEAIKTLPKKLSLTIPNPTSQTAKEHFARCVFTPELILAFIEYKKDNPESPFEDYIDKQLTLEVDKTIERWNNVHATLKKCEEELHQAKVKYLSSQTEYEEVLLATRHTEYCYSMYLKNQDAWESQDDFVNLRDQMQVIKHYKDEETMRAVWDQSIRRLIP